MGWWDTLAKSGPHENAAPILGQERMLVMLLNRNLALSGIALVIAGCSSKSTDDDDISGAASGGAPYNGQGGADSAGGINGTPSDGGAGNPNNVGGDGNSANVGCGANAGAGNQAGDNATGNGTGGSCTVKSVRAQLTPPVIEFQVDITNSMTKKTATTGSLNKWQATQQALNSVLPKLDQNWLVGITFFNKPGPQDTGCYKGEQRIDIAPLTTNLASITSAINGISLDPNTDTWTPTLNAWQFAFDYVTGQWPARGQYASSNKYIVFMTDGVPTVNRDGCKTGSSCTSRCIAQSEYDFFVSVVEGAGVPNGVKTFFIGVPGSEEAQGAPYDPRAMLSQMAIAGGTAPAGCTAASAAAGQYCHIDLTQAADFTSALANAIEYTVGAQVKPQCDFDIPKPSDSATYIDLGYTTVDFLSSDAAQPQRLVRATDANCADGQYYFNDPNKPTQLKLCPTMCDQLGQTTSGSVQVNFECIRIG
jgi:hypothetical protein